MFHITWCSQKSGDYHTNTKNVPGLNLHESSNRNWREMYMFHLFQWIFLCACVCVMMIYHHLKCNKLPLQTFESQSQTHRYTWGYGGLHHVSRINLCVFWIGIGHTFFVWFFWKDKVSSEKRKWLLTLSCRMISHTYTHTHSKLEQMTDFSIELIDPIYLFKYIRWQ